MEYRKGEHVKHPKKDDWGLGEVLEHSRGNIVRVFFDNAGEKKIATNYVQLVKVTGEQSADSLLNKVKAECMERYRIGRKPRISADHNRRTWQIIESKLSATETASLEQLVIWCKGHDHSAGGRGFVNYCIKNGWLVPAGRAMHTLSRQPLVAERPEQNNVNVNLFGEPKSSMTPELFEDYIDNFFGYGRLSSPLWFIGMEEGVGEESLNDRLAAWRTLGKPATGDIREFHRLINEPRWFTGKAFQNAQIQRTWKGPILAALAYFNMPVGTEEVRRYQVEKLATDDLALLELMPLPHKSLAAWNHDAIYSTKAIYRETIAPRRIAWFNKQIEKMAPKAVVMYGTTPPYPDYWRSIVQGSLQSNDGWAFKKTSKTVFVVCKHPLARGLTDEYFLSIGNFLRASINSN